MYGESNREIYNTICKINSQWGFAVLNNKKKRAWFKNKYRKAFTAKKSIHKNQFSSVQLLSRV